MIATDLSASEVIGYGYTAPVLREHLMHCLDDCPKKSFSHFTVVPKLDQSVRVFGQGPFADSVPFPNGIWVSPEEIAQQLVNLAPTEARYLPFEKLTFLAFRGWTIHRATSADGRLVVAAYASWIPAR
jgi:hypothetical protein